MQRRDGSGGEADGAARMAVRMGRHARRVLRAGHGSVLAAFTSTLYLESSAGIACIAPPATPCGPLNVIVHGFTLPAAAEPGRAHWRADETLLAIDGLGTFALSPRVDWAPPRPRAVNAAAIRAGLASMQAALAARPPPCGEVLAAVLGTSRSRCAAEPGSRVTETFPARGSRSRTSWRPLGVSAGPGSLDARFARIVPALEQWIGDALRGRDASSSRPIVDLLGCGRGLTPSGDDCVSGVLVALHAFGERGVAASVAHTVTRHAPCRTGRLSAAHLEAACAGEAVEPVHEAIGAIAGNTCPERALDLLERFGHGSGFDALAGVLIMARAIARPDCRSRATGPVPATPATRRSSGRARRATRPRAG